MILKHREVDPTELSAQELVQRNGATEPKWAQRNAYELAIKSIAKADDVLEKPTHSVMQTYSNLSEDRRAEIAAAIREHGAG